jgi:hypothetical protein
MDWSIIDLRSLIWFDPICASSIESPAHFGPSQLSSKSLANPAVSLDKTTNPTDTLRVASTPDAEP